MRIEISLIFLQEGEAKKQTPAQWQFRINAEMLPSYIPTRVADKVTNFVWELVFHWLTKSRFSYFLRATNLNFCWLIFLIIFVNFNHKLDF